MSQKITLKAWVEREFNPPPAPKTYQRWARDCWIFPIPKKIGRTYYVDPNARFTGPDHSDVTEAA